MTSIFLPSPSSFLINYSDFSIKSADLDISKAKIVTLLGSEHSFFTLSISLTFLAEIITSSAPKSMNYFVNSSPIPEDPPVIQILFKKKKK
jgi:hypothetical protein